MAVNKVVYDGNTLIDLTSDSVTPETLVRGTTAHDSSGKSITGVADYAPIKHSHEIQEVNGLQTALGTKSNTSDLTAHTGNTTVHITAAERTAWNAKASTSTATQSAAGLMSADDKKKLDGVAPGANAYSHPSSHPASMITGLATVATSGSYNDLTNKPTIPAAVTVDSSLSSTSTNPVQNKVVNSALSEKLPSSGGTLSGTVTLSNSSAQSGQPAFKWKAVNSKTPYVGYCTGSTDATFMVGSLAGTTYQTGLSIGGSSGNLLWKGTKVATTADIPTSLPASDVSSWAKASSKPSYTASEVGAVPTTRTINGKALGANISLTASDVGAATTADITAAIGNAIAASY